MGVSRRWSPAGGQRALQRQPKAPSLRAPCALSLGRPRQLTSRPLPAQPARISARRKDRAEPLAAPPPALRPGSRPESGAVPSAPSSAARALIGAGRGSRRLPAATRSEGAAGRCGASAHPGKGSPPRARSRPRRRCRRAAAPRAWPGELPARSRPPGRRTGEAGGVPGAVGSPAASRRLRAAFALGTAPREGSGHLGRGAALIARRLPAWEPSPHPPRAPRDR